MSPQITYSIAIITAYLIGSIASAILISKWMRLPDPRNIGSGNPGATNVLRSGNKKAAALTLLADLLKGLLPVLAGRWLQFEIIILCCIGLAAILGHMYPIYYRFRGGKGVATTLGALLGIAWPLALMWALIWLGTAIITRYSSLAALLATLSLPLICWLLNYPHPILKGPASTFVSNPKENTLFFHHTLFPPLIISTCTSATLGWATLGSYLNSIISAQKSPFLSQE